MLEEEVFPAPPPGGIQIINNESVEVCKPAPRVIVEVEPVKQDDLIQYTDRSGGSYEIRSSGYYSYGGGYHMNTSRGGGNWGSRNAPVRTPNPPGCGLNTQGCRR